MANRVASIHLKRQRGRMVVIVHGRTPTGQDVLGDQVILNAKSIRDPGFKAEVIEAMKVLMPESPSPS